MSDLSDNHSDSTVDVATSNEIDSDDETVDVADDSDINDGDETDSFTYVDSPISKSVLQSVPDNSHFDETKIGRRKNNKDFLSEIYNSEVTKVQAFLENISFFQKITMFFMKESRREWSGDRKKEKNDLSLYECKF